MNDWSPTRAPVHPLAVCSGVFWFRSFPTVSCIASSLTASTSSQSCISTVGQVTGVHDSELVLPNNRLERSGSTRPLSLNVGGLNRSIGLKDQDHDTWASELWSQERGTGRSKSRPRSPAACVSDFARHRGADAARHAASISSSNTGRAARSVSRRGRHRIVRFLGWEIQSCRHAGTCPKADHRDRPDGPLSLQPEPDISGVLTVTARYRDLGQQLVVVGHTRWGCGPHPLRRHTERRAVPGANIRCALLGLQGLRTPLAVNHPTSDWSGPAHEGRVIELRTVGRSAVRWAGVVPRRAKLEAPAPRDPGPLPSVRPVCAATRGLTRRSSSVSYALHEAQRRRKAREKSDPRRAGNMKKSRSKRAESPSELIDARIEDLDDWRGEMLSRLRALIKEADPEVAEEWKWRGTPVWSHNGLICTGETYKTVVKMTFAKGASLKDPSGLFNSSLEGNARRAIDFHEGDKLDEEALKALIRAAVALNKSSARG